MAVAARPRCSFGRAVWYRAAIPVRAGAGDYAIQFSCEPGRAQAGAGAGMRRFHHSETAAQAPLCTMVLARIVRDAGVPDGAVNAMLCTIPEAQRMVEDDRLKVLSFTGSAAVGWALKARAGKKRVVLELGGNAGVAIHSDANLDFAAGRCVAGGFAYSGQVCISVQRIYVHKLVFDEFASKLLDRVKKLRLGDPLSEQTDIGPMISVEAAQRAERWIREAVNSGATLLAGGERDGSFLQPTVLTGTKPHMNVCAQEVFAPVVTLESYDKLDDAIASINDSPYGLQAGVFTNDMRAAMHAFESIEAGGIIVNDVPTYRADPMPYGGAKDSGMGREGVRYAIQEFTETRVLVVNPLGERNRRRSEILRVNCFGKTVAGRTEPIPSAPCPSE